jgi:hypothetical protein
VTRTISGRLDLAAYERLAQQHRPTDSEALAAEARRLYRAGHSANYVASALRLPLDVVMKAIGEDASK